MFQRFALLLVLVLVMGSSLGAEPPQLTPVQRVLIIHSYHQGYTWTDSLHNAITETLLSTREDILERALYVEYMDTQRTFTADTFDLLEEIYRDKYTRQEVRFDVIIVTDDPALDFIQERGESIFGAVPVVFCGINNLDPSRLDGYPLFTGVNEVIDVAGTLELALHLRPQAERFVIISDATFTGRINTEIYRSVRSRFADRVQFEELLELEPDELSRHLRALEPTDAVLSLSYFATPDGRRLSVERSFAFISAASRAPVFSLWDFALGTGAVGGSVVSAAEQGGAAADMALRILAGTHPEEIPLLMESPNVLMVDHQELRNHRISTQMLPEGTVITGRPETPLRVYWAWIVGLLVFVLVQSLLIVALLSSRHRRKRIQRELETITANTPDIIMRVDRNGRCLYINSTGQQLTGRTADELVGAYCGDESSPIAGVSGWWPFFSHVLDEKTPYRTSYETETADGRSRSLESRLVPEFREDNQLNSILVIIRDATEEIRTRRDLARSLEEREVLLREIHHRVKNNLQVVASLINISILGKQAVEDALREVQQRVIAMAQIHEQLYQSGNFAYIELENYVRNVVSHIVMAYEDNHRIPEVLLDVQPVQIKLDLAVPFGLILTELVTNTLKHAFNGVEKPIIAVDVQQHEDMVLLRVADNGNGLPADLDFTSATGTGMTLIRGLTQQIRGSISTNRHGPTSCLAQTTDLSTAEAGPGTTVEIRFPKRR